MYNPSALRLSTSFLTASHNGGATCHSSISRGFAPFNNSDGLTATVESYDSRLSGSCILSTLAARLSAVVVLPHHLGPTINVAPNDSRRNANSLSAIRGK